MDLDTQINLLFYGYKCWWSCPQCSPTSDACSCKGLARTLIANSWGWSPHHIRKVNLSSQCSIGLNPCFSLSALTRHDSLKQLDKILRSLTRCTFGMAILVHTPRHLFNQLSELSTLHTLLYFYLFYPDSLAQRKPSWNHFLLSKIGLAMSSSLEWWAPS